MQVLFVKCKPFPKNTSGLKILPSIASASFCEPLDSSCCCITFREVVLLSPFFFLQTPHSIPTTTTTPIKTPMIHKWSSSASLKCPVRQPESEFVLQSKMEDDTTRNNFSGSLRASVSPKSTF